MIGIIPDPTHWHEWPAMEAMLEPAAKLGKRDILEPDEMVWTVHQNGSLKAACVARLTNDNHGEIVLCGGVGAKEWAVPLSDRICEWFRDEGMKVARIYGRKGWARLLDWREIAHEGRLTAFERVL